MKQKNGRLILLSLVISFVLGILLPGVPTTSLAFQSRPPDCSPGQTEGCLPPRKIPSPFESPISGGFVKERDDKSIPVDFIVVQQQEKEIKVQGQGLVPVTREFVVTPLVHHWYPRRLLPRRR